jgi:hypothetical protein
MNTQYNTLTLAQPVAMEAQEKPSRGKMVVAALFLVAAAGVVAVATTTSSVKVNSAVDASYQALEATPVNCDKGTGDYSSDLPRWDPAYSTQKDFYNACYYSFRCCTTTGNGNGCYVSDNFGAACKSCLKMNGPKFVKKDCLDFIADPETKGFTMDDLMADNGVPHTLIPDYAVMFENQKGNPKANDGDDTRSCWQQRGPEDKQVVDYSDRCFEVLSWCNLLCPRDTPQTVDHVMCKHCTLFGFDAGYWDIANFKEAVKNIAAADAE